MSASHVLITLGTYQGGLIGLLWNPSDPQTFRIRFMFSAHSGPVTALTANAPESGKLLASAGMDQEVHVYSLELFEERARVLDLPGRIECLAVPSNEVVLVGCATTGRRFAPIEAYSAQRKWSRILSKERAHRGAVLSLAVHRSGRMAVSVGQDARCRVWDSRTFTQASVFRLSRMTHGKPSLCVFNQPLTGAAAVPAGKRKLTKRAKAAGEGATAAPTSSSSVDCFVIGCAHGGVVACSSTGSAIPLLDCALTPELAARAVVCADPEGEFDEAVGGGVTAATASAAGQVPPRASRYGVTSLAALGPVVLSGHEGGMIAVWGGTSAAGAIDCVLPQVAGTVATKSQRDVVTKPLLRGMEESEATLRKRRLAKRAAGADDDDAEGEDASPGGPNKRNRRKWLRSTADVAAADFAGHEDVAAGAAGLDASRTKGKKRPTVAVSLAKAEAAAAAAAEEEGGRAAGGDRPRAARGGSKKHKGDDDDDNDATSSSSSSSDDDVSEEEVEGPGIDYGELHSVTGVTLHRTRVRSLSAVPFGGCDYVISVSSCGVVSVWRLVVPASLLSVAAAGAQAAAAGAAAPSQRRGDGAISQRARLQLVATHKAHGEMITAAACAAVVSN